MAGNCKFQLSIKSKDGTVLLNCYADTKEEFVSQIVVLQEVNATLCPFVPEPPANQPRPSVYEQKPQSLDCGLCGSQDIRSRSDIKNGRRWSGKFCNNCGAANFGHGWQKGK